MSLVVWLPLDGSLNNNGLSNVSMINSGATVDNSGKIGKCYYFSGSSYLYENTYDWTNFNKNTFSLCCWYKQPSVASGNSQMICIGTNSGWNNIRIGLLRRTSNGYPMFSVSDGTNNVNYNFTATSFPLNVWNHIAITFDNGTMTMYLNGEFHKTSTTTIRPVLNSSQHLGVGAASNGAEKLLGYLNDIRIYDHCLSAREVHEISKALILHYKLDDKFALEGNHVEPDGTRWTHLIHHNNPAGGVFPVDSNFPEGVFVDKDRWFDAYPTLQKYNGFEFLLKTKLTSGATETKYRWVQRKSPLTATWEDCSTNYVTRTTSSGYTNGTLGGGMYILNNNTHFVIANKTKGNWFGALGSWTAYNGGTPGFPNNVVTTGYMDLYMRTDVIYDVSGYHRDGTLIGTLTMGTDTPKYSKSMTFAAGNNHIVSPTLNTAGIQDSYTIAWWSKSSGMGGKMAWGSYNGNRLNLYPSGSAFYWNTGDGTNNPIKNGSSNLAFAGFQGAWHHYAMVGDGTTGKLYIDGSLRGTASTYKPFTATTVYVSGWDSTASYVWPGSLSDFRIYGTALSEQDVYELSHVPAYIDNLGDQFEYELIEPNENIFTLENLQKYCVTALTNDNAPKLTTRNGAAAISCGANVFYQNSAYVKVLADEFKPNTRYVLDLWVDTDDLVSGGANRNGGFYAVTSVNGSNIINENGSYVQTAVIGNHDNPIGWQHVRIVTPENGTVLGIQLYYYTSIPVFYRLDSTITEYHSPDVKILKTGILECSNLKERDDRENAAYGKGGGVETRETYEI